MTLPMADRTPPALPGIRRQIHWSISVYSHRRPIPRPPAGESIGPSTAKSDCRSNPITGTSRNSEPSGNTISTVSNGQTTSAFVNTYPLSINTPLPLRAVVSMYAIEEETNAKVSLEIVCTCFGVAAGWGSSPHPHNDTATTSQSSGLGMRMPSVNVVDSSPAPASRRAQPWLSLSTKIPTRWPELVRKDLHLCHGRSGIPSPQKVDHLCIEHPRQVFN